MEVFLLVLLSLTEMFAALLLHTAIVECKFRSSIVAGTKAILYPADANE